MHKLKPVGIAMFAYWEVPQLSKYLNHTTYYTKVPNTSIQSFSVVTKVCPQTNGLNFKLTHLLCLNIFAIRNYFANSSYELTSQKFRSLLSSSVEYFYVAFKYKNRNK